MAFPPLGDTKQAPYSTPYRLIPCHVCHLSFVIHSFLKCHSRCISVRTRSVSVPVPVFRFDRPCPRHQDRSTRRTEGGKLLGAVIQISVMCVCVARAGLAVASTECGWPTEQARGHSQNVVLVRTDGRGRRKRVGSKGEGLLVAS